MFASNAGTGASDTFIAHVQAMVGDCHWAMRSSGPKEGILIADGGVRLTLSTE